MPASRSTFQREQSEQNRLVHIVKSEQRRENIHARSALLRAVADQNESGAPSRGAGIKYSRREVLTLKKIFDEYDVDGSGSIELVELVHALDRHRYLHERRDGNHRTLEQRQAANGLHAYDFAQSLFSAMDADDNGTVDFGELLRLMYPLASEAELELMRNWVGPPPPEPPEEEELTDEQRREIRAMFNLYDKDHSGTITLAEFRLAMRRCGCDGPGMEDDFAAADEDGNGEIDVEEWTRHMKKIYNTAPCLTDAMLYGPYP